MWLSTELRIHFYVWYTAMRSKRMDRFSTKQHNLCFRIFEIICKVCLGVQSNNGAILGLSNRLTCALLVSSKTQSLIEGFSAACQDSVITTSMYRQIVMKSIVSHTHYRPCKQDPETSMYLLSSLHIPIQCSAEDQLLPYANDLWCR